MTSQEKPINVLLVDDLQENLVALEALLQQEGVTCLKANTGEEALELLLVHDVALALLDVQMPGMDGFELAEYMRGGATARHVPIIFVTAGSADARRRFQGYEAGAVDFIQKPIESDVLRSKANVFFDLYRQRRQIIAQRDELEAYAHTLRTVNRRRHDFIAVLGHELRNPIMALRAGLELIRRDADPKRRQAIKDKMNVQVNQLARLVDDLLDVARIDQGKISLQPERVELQSIIYAAVDACATKMESGRHELTVDLPPDPVWFVADFTRVAQVVTNLLANAAKYTPSQGSIQLSAERQGDSVEITVADNGIGVAQDMQLRIFDLFTQSDGPDARSSEGLGIGLALVKQLVELHGGGIFLESRGPGTGSRFTVRLPAPA